MIVLLLVIVTTVIVVVVVVVVVVAVVVVVGVLVREDWTTFNTLSPITSIAILVTSTC